MALVLPVPVLAGDWPDPSAIRVGDETVAVATSGGSAPIFRVLSSRDMRSWRIAGSVFTSPPRWAKRDFWAPEITRLSNGRFAVFYSALPRKGKSWYCLGVATAAQPEGPWRDRGRPLRCTKYGSIDPYVTRDERGRLYLLWKEDGNEFQRPTPIFAQRLREDGSRLLGRPKALIRNRPRTWERKVIEAAHVERRGDYFYLLYSGGLCCTRKCAYAVGVARSKRLLGPWRRYPGNPILRSGNGWRCPGHATVVDDGNGGETALFHAYRSGSGPDRRPPDAGRAVHLRRERLAPDRGRPPARTRDRRRGHRLQRQLLGAGARMGVGAAAPAGHPHRQRAAAARPSRQPAAARRRRALAARGHRELHRHRHRSTAAR